MADVVDLSVPVGADLIVLARLAASTIAARAGFDLEEIEDFRLAVDELCVSVSDGVADGRLQLRYVRDQGQIDVDCALVDPPGPSPDGNRPLVPGLSERILDALVDAHGLEREDGRTRAWLRKCSTRHPEG